MKSYIETIIEEFNLEKIISHIYEKELNSNSITASEARAISKKNSFFVDLKKKVDEAVELKKTIDYVSQWIKWSAENGKSGHAFNSKEVHRKTLPRVIEHFESLGYSTKLSAVIYPDDYSLIIVW
jgi:superfamily I DNA/RNA helicase